MVRLTCQCHPDLHCTVLELHYEPCLWTNVSDKLVDSNAPHPTESRLLHDPGHLVERGSTCLQRAHAIPHLHMSFFFSGRNFHDKGFLGCSCWTCEVQRRGLFLANAQLSGSARPALVARDWRKNYLTVFFRRTCRVCPLLLARVPLVISAQGRVFLGRSRNVSTIVQNVCWACAKLVL